MILVTIVSQGSFVVRCLSHNPGVLGCSRTGSSGQDTSKPQPSAGETQERYESYELLP